MLFSRIRAAEQARRLEQHRKTDAGLADLLNYAAMVDDGVIVGKNGAFMAAWLYRGEDNASASGEQRNLVSYRINQALSRLGQRLDDPCGCGAASRAALPRAGAVAFPRSGDGGHG